MLPVIYLKITVCLAFSKVLWVDNCPLITCHKKYPNQGIEAKLAWSRLGLGSSWSGARVRGGWGLVGLGRTWPESKKSVDRFLSLISRLKKHKMCRKIIRRIIITSYRAYSNAQKQAPPVLTFCTAGDDNLCLETNHWHTAGIKRILIPCSVRPRLWSKG